MVLHWLYTYADEASILRPNIYICFWGSLAHIISNIYVIIFFCRYIWGSCPPPPNQNANYVTVKMWPRESYIECEELVVRELCCTRTCQDITIESFTLLLHFLSGHHHKIKFEIFQGCLKLSAIKKPHPWQT